MLYCEPGIQLVQAATPIELEVRGKISQTPHTAHYLTLMRDEVIDALSIGFDPMR